MNQIEAIRWITKAAIVGALTVGLCALITPMTRNIPSLPPLTKDDEAQPALNRYRREAIPDIALVGSSLSRRLDESYFLPLKVRNIAISGDSSLTGLQIIASYPRVPGIILVEANIVSREIDTSLVKRFSGTSSDFSILRPIRTTVAYFNSRPESPAEAVPSFDDILQQRPLDHDNAIAIERAQEEYNKPNQDIGIQKGVEALGRLTSALMARGSSVYFYELPYPEEIERTNYIAGGRAAVRRNFGDPSHWLRLKYPIEEMRFEDHAHLDKRSALIVARAMESEILTLLHSRQVLPAK